MHTLDWLLIIPFAYFVIRGFMKGLVIEVFTILALICGLIGSMKFTNHLLQVLEPLHNHSTVFVYMAYLVIFLAIFFLVHLLGKLIEKVLKLTALNLFNRFAGAALGFLKAALMVSVIYWLTDQNGYLTEEFKEHAASYRLLSDLAPGIIGFVTDHIPYFRELIEEAERYFQEVMKGVDAGNVIESDQ